MTRIVEVTYRVVSYEKRMVPLIEHLAENVAEVYVSKENKCVEIRFPTRVEHYTHYVGHVSFADLKMPLEEVKALIEKERHMDFLETHEEQIVWSKGFNNCVLT